MRFDPVSMNGTFRLAPPHGALMLVVAQLPATILKIVLAAGDTMSHTAAEIQRVPTFL